MSDPLRALGAAAAVLAALGVLGYVVLVGINTLVALQHPDHHRRARARRRLDRLLRRR